MKKLLCILIVLLLAVSARASVVINLTDALLLSDDGVCLTEKGVYSRIFPLGGGLYAATKEDTGLVCVLNGEGETVSDKDYSFAASSGGRIILTSGLYSALFDFEMNRLTPFAYRLIAAGEDGGFLAFKTDIWDDTADRVYYLDADGNEYPTQNTILYAFSMEGGLPAPAVDGRSGLTGYMNGWGEWMTPAEYLSAGAFHGLYAAASVKDGTGLIDRDGDWILKPEYDSVRVTDKLILSVKGTLRQVYAVREKRLTSLYSGTNGVSLLNNGFVIYGEDGAMLMNADGSLNASFGPDTILYDGSGNGIIVSEYEGMYLYDMVSRVTSDGFLAITPLGGGLYKTCSESTNEDAPRYLFGVMDDSGTELLKPIYEAVEYPGNNLLAARSGNVITLFTITNGEAAETAVFE